MRRQMTLAKPLGANENAYAWQDCCHHRGDVRNWRGRRGKARQNGGSYRLNRTVLEYAPRSRATLMRARRPVARNRPKIGHQDPEAPAWQLPSRFSTAPAEQGACLKTTFSKANSAKAAVVRH